MSLTIKAVAARTGVSEHTLRAWERRYGIPRPNRVPTNRYRLYDEHDIADVLWMKRQIDNGVPPAQASMLLKQQQRPMTASVVEQAQPIATLQSNLQNALLDSDERAARQLLDEAFTMFTVEQAAIQIVAPTLREVGDRWLRNEIAVWQEHLASNLIRQKLLSIFQSQPTLPLIAPQVVAACAPAEEHELGLLLFALLARRQGWRVSYLGQETPLADIGEISNRANPDVLVVSVTTVVGLASLIPWLIEANRPTRPIVFGGRLLKLFPTLQTHLPGAYLGNDALAAARALVTIKPRAEMWLPSRRALSAAQALMVHRLKFAGDAVDELMTNMPASAQQRWHGQDLNQATLYLADALASALAFDTPELIDHEKTWLSQAMPPRHVPVELIAKHIQVCGKVLHRLLAPEQAKQFEPLLERMANHTWTVQS